MTAQRERKKDRSQEDPRLQASTSAVNFPDKQELQIASDERLQVVSTLFGDRNAGGPADLLDIHDSSNPPALPFAWRLSKLHQNVSEITPTLSAHALSETPPPTMRPVAHRLYRRWGAPPNAAESAPRVSHEPMRPNEPHVHLPRPALSVIVEIEPRNVLATASLDLQVSKHVNSSRFVHVC